MMSQYGTIEVIMWREYGLVSFSGTLLGWKFHYVIDEVLIAVWQA
jgi:hypothetical protein